MAPERWLESLVVHNVAPWTSGSTRFVYSQVPAFAALDRAMLDVLTCTRDGRLAVLELKADEDIHLPLQGLDYWARVRWQQQHGEFARKGYFAGAIPARRRCCTWWRRPCASILLLTFCCATFRRESNGNWCRWMSAGGMACGW